MTPKQVYKNQIKLQIESKNKREIQKGVKSREKNSRESERSKEKEKESEKREGFHEKNNKESEKRKQRKQKSFYVKESELRRAFFTTGPMVMLLYKEAYLNTNKLNHSFPNAFVSLL